MNRILSIAASALVLAGCANGYDKSAQAPACKQLAEAARSPALQVSGPGFVMSGGFLIPGRNLGGSGKLDMDWPNSPGCIREVPEKTPSPKHYDLNKIGMAL